MLEAQTSASSFRTQCLDVVGTFAHSRHPPWKPDPLEGLVEAFAVSLEGPALSLMLYVTCSRIILKTTLVFLVSMWGQRGVLFAVATVQ